MGNTRPSRVAATTARRFASGSSTRTVALGICGAVNCRTFSRTEFSELFANPLPASIISVLLSLFVLTSWSATQRSYGAGMAWLTLGCLLVIWLAQRWYPASNALVLLALPSGIAMLGIGRRAGYVTAAVSTLLIVLYSSSSSAGISSGQNLVAITTVWGVVALIWLAIKPGHTMIAWSWSRLSPFKSAPGGGP